MFTIGTAHWLAFRAAAAEDFTTRAMRHFRASMKLGALDDDQLRARIDRGVDEAAGFGLSSEQQVIAFLTASLVLGPAFASEVDWAREVLRSPALGADDKALLLLAAEEQSRAR